MAVGLREYARHRKARGLTGGTLGGVQDAIRRGCLSRSLTADGKISSAEAADAEWLATTKSDYVPLTGPSSASVTDFDAPQVASLAESRARREAALAELAEIELAEKRGELLPAIDVERSLVSVFVHCKTKLLGIPSRVRQQDPTLSSEQIALIETLIREACEDLADASLDELKDQPVAGHG